MRNKTASAVIFGEQLLTVWPSQARARDRHLGQYPARLRYPKVQESLAAKLGSRERWSTWWILFYFVEESSAMQK